MPMSDEEIKDKIDEIIRNNDPSPQDDLSTFRHCLVGTLVECHQLTIEQMKQIINEGKES